MYSDFVSEYGILLSQGLGWRDFRRLLIGLLAADTRVWRHFDAKRNNDKGVGVTGHGG